MNKFATRLKQLRIAKGLSRKQLAEALSVSVRLISYWETGKRECDFDTLIKLSQVFNESIDYILGTSDI